MPEKWVKDTLDMLEENIKLYHTVHPDWYRKLYSNPQLSNNILLSESEIHQLIQLIVVTWDGNLVSEDARNKLIERGYVRRRWGFNWLTEVGVKVLIDAGFLNA